MSGRGYTNVRQALPFSVIAAMIRMGKKYEIHYLRDEGLVRLKLEFPEKLNDFDKTPKSFPRTHIKCVSADEQANMEIEAINLAHECGIQTILPALYFQVVLKMVSAKAIARFMASDPPDRRISSTEKWKCQKTSYINSSLAETS